jgi:hypothetical protein
MTRCKKCVDFLPLVVCEGCKSEKGYDWQFCWNTACSLSPAFDDYKRDLKLSLPFLSISQETQKLCEFDREASIYIVGKNVGEGVVSLKRKREEEEQGGIDREKKMAKLDGEGIGLKA